MTVPIIADSNINRPSVSTTLTFNMPTPRPAGDLYVALGFKDDDPAWTGIPSNWTEIFQETDGGAVRLGAWWWIGGNEPASYTLNQDNEVATAVVLRITGANLGTPIDAFAVDNGSGSNQSAPAATVTQADTLVIRAISVDRDDVTGTPSTTIFVGGGGGANDVGDGSSFEDGPASGGTGTAAFTHANDEFASATICIAPFIPFISGNLSDVVFPQQNSYVGPFEIG